MNEPAPLAWDASSPTPLATPSELQGFICHERTRRAEDSSWQSPAPAEIARLVPQYRIETLLGRGGMGAVYRGVQEALHRPVAIKILPGHLSGDTDFISRFQREARMLAKLQHPGIVAIYGFGQAGEGQLYIVMEYVDGTDLQRILRGPGLQADQALELFDQIADAVSYAHGQGVMHRDIKPANILVTKEGRAKVADFGLARPMNEDYAALTLSGVVMGTPAYMAPEQREGQPDLRSDIYALGVLLYEMLTGKRPEGIFAPASAKVPVDPRLDQVVTRAMQHDADRRYQHIRELRADVDRIRKEGSVVRKAGSVVAGGAKPPPRPKEKAPRKVESVAAAEMEPVKVDPETKTQFLRRLAFSMIPVVLVAIAWPVITYFAIRRSESPASTNMPPEKVAIQSTPSPPPADPSPASPRVVQEKPPDNSADVKKPVSLPVPLPVEGDLPPAFPGISKEGPLVNSLGMTFVPVPGTRVLMCIHETRKGDYAQYAEANSGVNAAWKEATVNGVPVSERDDHPVVNVNWNDAREFCAWLSTREGRNYRLPTDREWSFAVGIAGQEPADATPSSLDKKLAGVYPWGKTWPPPAGAGNFADTAALEKFPTHGTIKDYTDGYATTSPVMSFPPNELGIYDLSGNVLEWCEDWYDSTQERRVARGGAWRGYGDIYLLSSCRYHEWLPERRYAEFGFRCVIAADATPGAPAAGGRSAE